MRRPLTDDEAATLRFLVSDGRPGVDELLTSLPFLVVAEAVTSDGLTVHVLVNQDGVPTSLEVHGDGDDAPALPPVTSLRLLPADV